MENTTLHCRTTVNRDFERPPTGVAFLNNTTKPEFNTQSIVCCMWVGTADTGVCAQTVNHGVATPETLSPPRDDITAGRSS